MCGLIRNLSLFKYCIVLMLSNLYFQPDLDASSSDRKTEVVFDYDPPKEMLKPWTDGEEVHMKECNNKTAFSNLLQYDVRQCCKYFYCRARDEWWSPCVSVKKHRSFFLELGLFGVNTHPHLFANLSDFSESAEKKVNTMMLTMLST